MIWVLITTLLRLGDLYHCGWNKQTLTVSSKQLLRLLEGFVTGTYALLCQFWEYSRTADAVIFLGKTVTGWRTLTHMHTHKHACSSDYNPYHLPFNLKISFSLMRSRAQSSEVTIQPSFLLLQGPYVLTHFILALAHSLSAPHLSLAPLLWGLWRQLAVRAGLCSIKTRPHLICHLFHCKYTLYVHTVLCSPWVLRPAVLCALAARHILGSSRLSILEPL